MWQFRESDEVVHIHELYENKPTLFSLKINHGGYFSKFPERVYLNGKVSHVDQIDGDEVSIHDIDAMMQHLGYGDVGQNLYYHFMIPNTDLDFGLQALRSDQDIIVLLKYGTRYKELNFYCEHGVSNLIDEIEQFWGDEARYENEVDNLDEEDDSLDSDYVVGTEIIPVVDMDMDLEVEEDEVALHFSDKETCSDDSDVDLTMNKRLRRVRRKNLSQQESTSSNNSIYFFVGQSFGSRDEVKKLIRLHAIETKRDLVIVKNDLRRIRVNCRGKFFSFNSDDGSTSDGSNEEVKKSCPWVLHVSPSVKDESWVVKTHKPTHECCHSRKVKQCTVSFLAQELVKTIQPNPTIPVKAVQDHFEKKYDQELSSMKCFRAKQMAETYVRGDYEEQYGKLRDYVMELQRRNEDTTVKLDVVIDGNPASPTRQFKRIYVCLGALKKGFKAGMRDILGLDGTFMKGPFPGQLLTAVGVDPNNGTYPLAYAVVEAETKNSWIWFLEYLGDDLELGTNSNFTFISDRQKGIIPAVEKVFPNAEHRFCLRHIHENMKQQWKGKAFKDHLWKCATSTSVPLFDESMEEFKAFNGQAYEWLLKIPPKHWARSHFSGRSRCDILLNNVCEVFNRQLIDARDQPIITALEYIREYLMKRIMNVGKMIAKASGPLTPTAAKLFEVIKAEASQQSVKWNGGHKYQVSGSWKEQHVVDLHDKSCSCRKWELTGIPCKHAVASIRHMANNGGNVNLPERWLDRCYRLDTWKAVYSFKINPLTGMDMWPKSSCPTVLTPPLHHKQIGRPKKKRKKSVDELSQPVVKGGKLSRIGKTVTCIKCKKKGHNSRTCKGQL